MIQQRFKEIDIAKGIGITLVVLGHLTTPLHDYIYSFHMPLFFILSGFFFSKNINLYKRSRLLLLSYTFYYLIALIKSLCLTFIHKNRPNIDTINPELINGPIWFIITLLSVTIIIWAFHRLTHSKYIISGLSFSLFWIGYIINKEQIILPLYLTQALLMQFFYYIGYLIFNLQIHNNTSIFAHITNSSPIRKICYIFISSLIIYYLNPHADVFLLHINFPVNLILTSLSGTTIILCISTFRLGFISTIFSDLGKLSLHVMGFHKLIISPLYFYIIIPIICQLNKNISIELVFKNQLITYIALIIILLLSYIWGKIITRNLNFIFK